MMCKLDDPTDQELFLPMILKGKAVLAHIDGNKWRVDNTEMKSDSAGVSYRRSKRLDDELDTVAKWGVVVKGIDAGDGWLQILVIAPRIFGERQHDGTTK